MTLAGTLAGAVRLRCAHVLLLGFRFLLCLEQVLIKRQTIGGVFVYRCQAFTDQRNGEVLRSVEVERSDKTCAQGGEDRLQESGRDRVEGETGYLPPLLSVDSTSISASRWNAFLDMKLNASWPNGSGFSLGLRAVRGARIPDRTKVSLSSCLGTKTCVKTT